MTNEERRMALRLARLSALNHAKAAENNAYNPTRTQEEHMCMATMWANVANAMKLGDPLHDGVDGVPDSAPWHNIMDHSTGR